MRLEPGAGFAGFTIERVLGSGGMGVVYLARNPRLDRLVALKVLGDLIAADPRGRARFEREAARLEHPNIVAIYDRADSEAESPWISMKFVSGGDVAQRLAERGGPLSPDEAVRILTDAAHGLDYAHQHGVLHRDVKPGNILLDRGAPHRDRALLTDFGIARALDDTLTLTGTAATFAYAAPERFHGTTADHRADIYSLGCTLYELLTATTPFPRTDQAAILAAHLTAPPPRPTDSRPGLPPGLNDVIAIAMAKNPDDRYPSCIALADAATRVLTSAQVARGNPRTAPTLAAPPRPESVATLPPADSPDTTSRADLPDSIRTALDSPHPEIRQGAVQALGTLLSSSDEFRADTARKALRDIAISDIPAVASAAREILGGASTMDSPRLPTARRGHDESSGPKLDLPNTAAHDDLRATGATRPAKLPGPALRRDVSAEGEPPPAPGSPAANVAAALYPAAADAAGGPQFIGPRPTNIAESSSAVADLPDVPAQHLRASGTAGPGGGTAHPSEFGVADRPGTDSEAGRTASAPRVRGRIAEFLSWLPGPFALLGAGLLVYGLRWPFAVYDEALPHDVDSIVYQGKHYIVALAVGAGIGGAVALALRRRSGVGQALLAGFGLTGLWGTAVLQTLGIRMAENPHPFSLYRFAPGSGYTFTLLGHYAIVLSGVCGVLALWMRGGFSVGVRLPRDLLSIASLALGSAACVAVVFTRMQPEGWAFLRDDYSWITAAAAVLTAMAVVAAFLRPRGSASAAVIGLALGGVAIGLFLYSQTHGLDQWGAYTTKPPFTQKSAAPAEWFIGIMLALAVVNLAALVKSSRRQVDSGE
ncbi:serine/threonine-protein kinase [Nocardia heshunensis]